MLFYCISISVIICLGCSSTQREKEDLSFFLQPTVFIESNHPEIIETARELTKDCITEADKAKALYEYVRDSHNMEDMEYSLCASTTLKTGGIICFDTAVLLAALCRSVGIPARLHIQKVTLKNRRKEKGKWVDSIFLHGIMGMHLNGEWHLYDTEGFAWKWVFWTRDEWRASEMPLEFHANRDCLFPSIDKAVFETLPVYFVDWYGSIYENLDKIFEGMLVADNSIYLEPTENVDSDNPKIIQKGEELTSDCKSEVDKVRRIYEFVRDSYSQGVCESDSASHVLECGGNNCGQRSILMAALCRAVGIPARLQLQEVTIKDFKYDDGRMGDDVILHGITGIYYDKEWYLFEPVGNKDKWVQWTQDADRANEMPVWFEPHRDCLFKEDEKIQIATLPIYFVDQTEEVVEFVKKIKSGEIGFF